jgi:putative ABC transport system permease protein
MMGVRLHRPTVRGRLRVDRGLLVLTGLVVALASALLAAVWPLTVRTADEAMVYSVREAGTSASVVATVPQPLYDGTRRRVPDAVTRMTGDIDTAWNMIPEGLRSILRPHLASLISPALQVTGPGPSRFVRLVYVQAPSEPPAVTWVSGVAPRSSAGPGEDDVTLAEDDPPWPVQVGLSEDAAFAMDLGPGDRVTVEDQFGQDIVVRISGIYEPEDPDDPAWTVARELLSPAVGTSDGVARTSVAALVSPEALPDLRIAVPGDELTEQVTFLPVPERVRWEQSSDMQQDIVELEAAPGLASGGIGWDSGLDPVLVDASAQVADARGRAQVLLVGLLVTAILTLVLAAQLLARRRAGPLTLARERGATLVGVGAELAVESVLVAVAGAAVGLAVTASLVGSVGWSWVPPVVLVASLAAPVLGTIEAARATSARRVPANRAARRTAERRRRTRRLVLEAAVVALAGVTFVALRQRGPVQGDLTPVSTPTVWALVGALLLVRVLPPLVRRVVRRTGRSAARLRFFVAARVAAGGLRALPLVVVVVAVAQLVLGTALAATQQRGQEAGALLAVGGDARLKAVPTSRVADMAAAIGRAPGVDAVVPARVTDGTLASSVSTGASVRLVIVDARAYERLLAASDLPDAPQLERLTSFGGGGDAPVPALLLGGPPGLENGLNVRWGVNDNVALDVVGEAPRVEAATEPVVVVDAAAFAAAGALADPDTIWALGPGAPEALLAAAEADPADTVLTFDAALASLRDAPLPTALVHLAVAASLLLLLLAGLGVVLGASLDAPARATALGRLRSLGLADPDVRRVLAGELVAPVLAGVLTGLVVGIVTAGATFGSLGLDEVTGQSETPQLVVPLWTWLAVAALPVVALLLAVRQSRRLQRTNLAQLLRTGDSR